jgi:endonuclease/exonuclease/phosphatase family metal-dependent hydrolase
MLVLTWNVQTDVGDPRRTGLINEQLRRLAPDLVALQEVRHDAGRDQLAELVAGTGLHTTHQADLLGDLPPEVTRFGGTAIATRWPHRLVEVREHRPAGPDDVHWWTAAVEVAVPGAGELLFVVPTTPWQPGADAARTRQAAEVAELDARYRGPLPSVVAGDLNAGPDAPSVRVLTRRHRFRDAWAAAGEGAGWTWSVDNPLAAAEIAQVLGRKSHHSRIDYVLVGPGPGTRVTAARLVGDRPVEGVWLSDHAAMLAELDIGFPEGGAPQARSPQHQPPIVAPTTEPGTY